MNYPRAIKLARQARGFTQAALAERCGVGQGFISSIESGARSPSLETLERIGHALDVPLYLILLLGSNSRDLVGISGAQASLLAKTALDFLTSGECEDGKPSRRRK